MLPANAAIADYGGAKANAQPVEDSSTDLDADDFAQMQNDCAMMTRTAGRAEVTFTGATYTSGTQSLSVTDHQALWGNAALVIPTVTQSATGVLLATWPTTVTDELGATVSVSFRRIKNVTISGSSTPLLWTAGTVTANTATFYLWTTGGVASAANGKTIVLEMA